MTWSPSRSEIAYVDRGYGWLKAGCQGRTLVTQSLIVPGSTLPGLATEEITMTYQGVTYLLGSTAARQSGLSNQADLADDAPVNPESRLLYLAALAYLAGTTGIVSFKVVAGLPVDTWEQQKDALKALLLGIREELVQLRVGEQEIQVMVTVEDAMVMPQPLGSALDFLLDRRGSLGHDMEFPVEISGSRTWPAGTVATWRWCVVDIGFNTLNTYALDNMEPVRRFTTSPRLGMAYAYQLIGKAAGGLGALEVQELMQRGSVRGCGPALAELGRQITRVVRSWNSPHFAFYLITGGGAAPLLEHILPGEPTKVLARNAQEANGRGYLKAGMQRWASDGNA
jgi:hypothetical protein